MNVANIEMFRGLSNMELAKLLGMLDKLELPAGGTLFEQGDPGDCMYLIEKGAIGLYAAAGDGTRRHLADLAEGDALGEMALLTGEARSATAVAAADTQLYVLNQEMLERLVAEHAPISSYFIRLLSRRLVSTNNRLQAAKETEAQRLAQALEGLDERLRQFAYKCIPLPRVSPALARHFGVDPEGEAFARLAPLLEADSARAPFFVVRAAAKPLLLESCAGRYDPDQMQRSVREAAGFYEASGQWAEAFDVHAYRGDWNEALDTLLRAKGALPDDQAKRVYAALDGCPAEPLLARFSLLERYVGYCRERAPEAGLAKLAAMLEAHGPELPADRLPALYEWCAELCRIAGRSRTALEYLRLAEAAAASADKIEAGAGGGDRMYGLAKQKLTARRSQLLAEGASRLLGRNRATAVAALLAAALCVAVFRLLEPAWGLSREGMTFIGIALAAVVLWIANIVPDYIVAFGMMMLWVLLGVVGTDTALSGFGSSAWMFMVFIMAMSAVIAKSGILYRFSLLALKRFPAHFRGQLWGIVAGGVLMNPLIPSSSTKVSLGVPIARTLSEAMGFKERSGGAAGLGLAAMLFYGFTAPFVMTGSYTNVMAYGLVSADKPIGWLQWFLYALPAFLVFGAVLLAILLRMFRAVEAPRAVSAHVLDEQLRVLGPLAKEERISLGTIVGSIVLMTLQPWHGIDSTWIMLTGFAVLVVSGALDRRTIATGIDWTFLLFLGAAFGFAGAVKELGIAEALSSLLGEHMAWFVSSPALFLLAVVLLSFAVTLLIRDDPAVILLVSALLPLGEQIGIHPWVIVFVILLSTDPFFFAYQSPTYLTAYYSSDGKAFSHRQGQRIGLAYGAAVLLLIALSVPYWKWLGLMP